MPVQWPGNTATKLARAATGGGFESDITAPPPADGETLWGPYIVNARPSGDIWNDTFEAGDFAVDETSTEVNYIAGSSPATSIVNDTNYVVANQSGPIDPPSGPFPEKQWENSPLGAAGNNALRFSYAEGVANPWSELELDLTTPQRTVWVAMDFRVPINFEHLHPSIAMNNKLFAIWMDEYGSGKEGSLVWIEFRANSDTDKGSNWYVNWTNESQSIMTKQGTSPFITYPSDQGRWMELIFCFTTSSANGVLDGSIETWRRWQDEATRTKVHEYLNMDLTLPTTAGLPQGWASMYLLGEHRSGYDVRTDYLVDNFVISTSSLL